MYIFFNINLTSKRSLCFGTEWYNSFTIQTLSTQTPIYVENQGGVSISTHADAHGPPPPPAQPLSLTDAPPKHEGGGGAGRGGERVYSCHVWSWRGREQGGQTIASPRGINKYISFASPPVASATSKRVA